MSANDTESQESCECPECDRSDFDSWRAVKIHYGYMHEGTLSGTEVACAWCGETHRRPDWQVEKYDRQFCDENCQGAWRAENRTGEDAFNWRSELCECEVCGEEFAVPPSRAEQNGDRFCGVECYAEWWSETKTGENHPQWRGGYEEYYGPSWPEQRRKARDRDGHTCQACGAHEMELETELSVHHIRPFNTFTSPAEANDLGNLVSLCRPCHAKWEGVPLRPEVVK